jgi:eukaryotic-like serine/threonine-protein kinase
VPHDAETICLKCLHKEPSKRYATAAELADELGRFLRGEPILARPVGRIERSWRWCRRNPRLAAASGLAALGLLVALVATTVGYFTTAAALKETRESQKDSELSFLEAFAAVNDLFTRVSEESLLNQPGMQPLRRDLLQRALDYYQRLLVRRRDNPELQDELGTTYYRVGLITEELESASKAIPWYEQAESLQRRLLADAPEMPERLEAMGATLNALGTAWFRLHDLEKAVAYYQQAVRFRNQLRELDHNNVEYVRLLANTHMNLGLVEGDSGRPEESLKAFTTAQDLRRDMLTRQDAWKLRRDLAKGEYNLGYVAISTSDLLNAEAHFTDAANQFERVLLEDPNDQDTQVLLSTCYRLVGDLGQYRDPPVDPIPWYSKAQQRLRRLIDQNPAVVDYQLEYAGVLLNRGEWEHGDSDATKASAALKTFDEVRQILQPLVDRFPKVPRYRRDLAVALTSLGEEQLLAGDKENARGSLQASLDHFRQLLAEEPDNKEWQQRMALARDLLASAADKVAPD